LRLKTSSLHGPILFLSLIAGTAAARAESAPQGIVLSTAPVRSLSLRDAFTLAQSRTETLQLQSENLYRLEQQYASARAQILPNLRFLFTETIQDQTGVRPRGSDDSGGSSNSNTRRDRPEGKFQIKQPLFSGFRDFNVLSALKSSRRREELLLKNESTRLFLTVARAFYAALSAETNLMELQNLLKLTEDRAKELSGRVKLGKSRQSELLTLRSQVAALKSQREGLLADVSFVRADLAFLTGVEMDGVALVNDPLSIVTNDTGAQFLAKAEERSDIRALREELAAARSLISNAKGYYAPSLGLTGNYYVERVGTQKPIDWDLIFSLDLPVFEGGANMSRVRVARSNLRTAELNLSAALRRAQTEIKQAHLLYQSAAARAEYLRDASQKARESFELQEKEYRYGLVNNLEVLEAMRFMIQNHQDLENALLDTQLRLLELKTATEELP
jgi:outer membrane protein